MIDFVLWVTLLSGQWIPGPFLIPGNVKAPVRVLRCVECGTWPVRIKQ